MSGLSGACWAFRPAYGLENQSFADKSAKPALPALCRAELGKNITTLLQKTFAYFFNLVYDR
ncbi:MAG: hypothetical protein LUE24_09570 [Lachnospiraceae bacterium]|nr:hypothetical protein [Lachnospiraceae bacterium]